MCSSWRASAGSLEPVNPALVFCVYNNTATEGSTIRRHQLVAVLGLIVQQVLILADNVTSTGPEYNLIDDTYREDLTEGVVPREAEDVACSELNIEHSYLLTEFYFLSFSVCARVCEC